MGYYWRSGKVFFDYIQNAKGKTIASVFSARPSVSAIVSMPVKWEELDNILPSDFTMLNVPDILKGHENEEVMLCHEASDSLHSG